MSTERLPISGNHYPVFLEITTDNSTITAGCSSIINFSLSAIENLPHTIFLYSSGSNSNPWQDPQNRWSQFVPQWRFCDLSGNQCDNIILSNYTSAISGLYTGYIFTGSCYYIDDMPSSGIDLWGTVNYYNYSSSIDDGFTILSSISSCVNSKVTARLGLTSINDIPTHLHIDQNGIDPLFTSYWKDVYIPYYITVRGNQNQIIFDVPIDESGSIYGGEVVCQLYDNLATSYIPRTSTIWYPDFYYGNGNILSAYDELNFKNGGIISGSFLSRIPLSSVMLSAHINVQYMIPSTTARSLCSLTGISDNFEIKEYINYDIRKFNESWDAIDTIHGYVFSPHIHDNTVLWDGLFNSVYGDDNSPEGKAFGRESYERIINFLENHSDIDTCNIDKLYSLLEETDTPIDDYGLDLPVNMRHIMDLLSVKTQRLQGTRCLCNQNIDNKYKIVTDENNILGPQKSYCKVCGHNHSGNLGEFYEIDTTTMVTAFSSFIVKDKYVGGNFRLITPTKSISGEIVYPLSSNYIEILELNPNNTYEVIKDRFCFFKFVDIPCGVQIEGLINWDDSNTTLSENNSSLNMWIDTDQIIDKILDYDLHNGLNLIK